MTFNAQANDNYSQDILEDFREVRLVLHTYTPRQIFLLQQGLQFLQCRQFCLMPCHRCVASENGVLTYRYGQCVRPIAYLNGEVAYFACTMNVYAMHILHLEV